MVPVGTPHIVGRRGKAADGHRNLPAALLCSTPTILERNAHSGNSGSFAIFAAISPRLILAEQLGTRFWHKADIRVATSNVRFWG